MRLASLVRLAAVVTAFITTLGAAPRLAAADGTYFTFGVGGGDVQDQLSEYTERATRVRAGIGHRFGNWAVEGFLATDFNNDSYDYDREFDSADTIGVDLKYLVRISNHFQGYVRGSASRMSTTMGGGGYNECFDCYGFGRDYSGRGLGAGAGLMLRGRVRALGFLYWPLFFVPAGPKVNASLYVDHGMDFYRLHPDDGSATIDAELHRWTFGFTVGQDF
jgi:hypothetical protein